MDTDAIVIGGGIAGLACAVALCQSGLRPLVLERSALLGGRARSWRDETTGDVVDIGPHILLSEYPNMLRLLEQLGTREHIVWQRGKFITLVDRPHPVGIYMHRLPAPMHFLPSMLKLPQVSLRDLASNRRLIWRVMRMNEDDMLALDAVDAETHLRREGVSTRFIDWFWRSASMTIMNVPLERCSAGALLGFFRYMIGISGYQVGFAGEGLGDLFAPAAARYVEEHGGQVMLNTSVGGIVETESGTVAGVRLDDGAELRARFCIAAIPPQDLVPLLPEHWPQRHELFRNLTRFEPSPYVSTYLWFDRKLTSECFWSRVWSPDNLNYDSYDLSNIRPGWADRPSVIASNIVYSHRAADLSDGDIVEATVRELSALAPDAARARVIHSRVHRIDMARPVPYPGSERLRPDVTTPIAGLFIAGDWIYTGLPPSMESAVRAAHMAAEQVLATVGKPRQVALPPPATQAAVRLIGGR